SSFDDFTLACAANATFTCERKIGSSCESSVEDVVVLVLHHEMEFLSAVNDSNVGSIHFLFQNAVCPLFILFVESGSEKLKVNFLTRQSGFSQCLTNQINHLFRSADETIIY